MKQERTETIIYQAVVNYGNISIKKFIYLSETKNFYDVVSDEAKLFAKRIVKESTGSKVFFSLEEAINYCEEYLQDCKNSKLKEIDALEKRLHRVRTFDRKKERTSFLGEIEMDI